MSQILVVSSDSVGVAAMLSVLDHAGHQARCASTFEDATRLLAQGPPDFVIADGHLGAFNGLPIIMRAPAAHPKPGATVTALGQDPGHHAHRKTLTPEHV